jgi:hypothetical protein
VKKKVGTHLFIDTNVLLNFYAFSNDDLNELEKLVQILKTKVVKLYITQQVVDEFYRNRDAKLAASFDTFRPFGNSGCPSFMTSLTEYNEYRKAMNTFQNARKVLTEKARAQADARELLADQLFKRVAAQAQVIPVDDNAYAAAEKRARLGNPPGKTGPTIGDELNWELLLAKVPNGSDLHVITKDSDYASKLNPTQPKVFLTDEWATVKKGNLYIHEQISLFFKTNYPDEDFSLEIEKRSSIESLIRSTSFASTHAAVASLEPYIPFLTKEEAEDVLQGALSNRQVVWIASDSDVEAFLNKMLQEHGDSLSETLRTRIQDVLGLNPVDLNPDEMAVGEKDVPN